MAGLTHNAEVALGVMGVAFQISAMAYMAALAYGSRCGSSRACSPCAPAAQRAPCAHTCMRMHGLSHGVAALGCCCCRRYQCRRRCRSVNTRVSNELGCGRAAAARLATYTAVGAVLVVQACLACTCWLAAKAVIGLMTNSDEVESLTLKVIPFLLPTFVSECQTAR